jgi:HlyD family secretion protein
MIFTVGGVITPAARLATVVPQSAKLVVEVRIAPSDIDQVHVGQTARMRFSAFNRNTTPEISGKLTHISPATTKDPVSGQSFYIGEVQMEGVATALGDRRLLPGMPVEVFISTESRTALSYLMKPLIDHAERGFRER